MIKNRSNKKAKAVALGLTTCVMCASMFMSGVFSSTYQAFAADQESNASSNSGLTKYYTDYDSYAEEQAAAQELNEELAAESMILLKNKDESLPLDQGSKVSVFGTRSVNLQVGGSGSGSSGGATKFLEDSLQEAGFKMNPKLYNLYSNLSTTQKSSEQGPGILTSATGSYKLYDDAALVVISRTGSEFNDNEVKNVAGHSDPTDHSQMLTDAEKELIEHVKENFDNIVLIINGPNAMELGDYEDDDAITGIIWIGLPGPTGIMALGKILNGEVNPSGRTVDVWEANVKNDPTWQNFRDNSQVDSASTVLDSTGEVLKTKIETVNTLDYEEGIYMGYRWYETAATENVLDKIPGYDATKAKVDEDDENYDMYYNRSTGVVYPFGYGQSYTTFKWEVVKTDQNKKLTERDQEVTIQIKVTNTGDYAGKDVVEMYSTPQYYTGGIEKSSVNLVNYQKTKLLQPGKSQTLTFTFTPWELASFDDVDANGNGFAGYELEAGTVTMSFRSDSHNVKDNCTVDYTVDKSDDKATNGVTGLEFKYDPVTETEVKAWFSQDDEFNTRRTSSVMAENGQALTFTSRADLVGTFPTAPTEADRMFNDETIQYLKDQEYDWSYEDEETDPWYKDKDSEDIPKDEEGNVTWTQASAAEVAARKDGKTEIQLIDMAGVDYNDAKWDEFLNQLSYDELVTLAGNGSFSTPAIASIGKIAASDKDGPAQLGNGTSWVCEVNVASTWNVELAYQQGVMVGNDSLYLGVQGWYGPGADIHRNANSGRNFEYYSQDGVQGGKIAAAVVRGARSKGVHVYIKHFAMNDQETNRYNVCTWATEQSMREIYLKTFELAVKEGGADGTMSAFNRIGLNSAANYRLYQNLLRNEWGFKGASVTDMYGADGTTYYPSGTGNTLARSFIYPLGSYRSDGRKLDGEWSEEKNCVMVATSAEDSTPVESYTQWYAVRGTAKASLYTAVNTNLMKNGVDTSALKGDDTLTTEVGKSYTQSIAVDAESINNGIPKYEISGGALPEGLTLDADTGAFVGKATEVGEFNFTVTLTVDGWVTQTASYKLTVTPNATLEAGKEVTLNASDYSAYAVGDTYSGGRMGYRITEVSATFAEALPGMTLNADGTLSGTPTTPGTYNVKVNYTLKGVMQWNGQDWGSESNINGVPSGTVMIVVPGEASGDDETETIGIVKVENTANGATITFTDGSTIQLTNGADGKDGANGKDGADGKDGAAGSGCGSVIGAGSAALAALAVLGGAVVVMRKKED